MTAKSKDLDDLAKATWDQSYDLPSSPNLWGAEPVPYVQRAIEIINAYGTAGCAIDVPCGDGRNTVPLARAFPFVIGADTALNALTIASDALDFNHVENCALLESDVFNLKFLDCQFDGVFCWDLLGHLRDPRSAIVELLRVCKPGRVVIGSVFALGDSTRGSDMVAIGDEEYVFADKFYFRYYSEEAIRTLVTSINAELVSLEVATWMEPPHEGYREYPHEHQSWAFAIRKPCE